MTTILEAAIKATRPTCSARTGEAPSTHGFSPLWCNRVIGVREFVDRNGDLRHYCAAPGHKEAVIGRYGERLDDWEARKRNYDSQQITDREELDEMRADLELMADEFHGRAW